MVPKRASQAFSRPTSVLRSTLFRLQRRVATAWEALRRWSRSPLCRIRPRVSLATGSVLVLMTLYLPTTMDSCNNHELGVKLASGARGTVWAGRLLHLLGGDRTFYLLCLLMAVFTLVLLFVSVLGSSLTQSHSLLPGLLVISGSVALLSTTDLFALAAFYQIWLGPTYIPFDVLLYLLPVACLRAEFWTKKGAILWVLILAVIGWGGFFADVTISRFYPPWDSRFDRVMAYLIAFAFSLLPLGLWLRHVCFRRCPSPLWPGMERRLAVFYVGVLACDIRLVTYEKLWGLIAFFLGVYLIFYGYWLLRKEAIARATALRVEPCDTRETITPLVAGLRRRL